MELGTFGAVIKFALELEVKASDFYETAAKITTTDRLKMSFETFLQKRQIRIETLKRLRRENTTEMILEPISGLEEEKYRIKIEIPEDSSDKVLLEFASDMERQNQEFYGDAAKKIEFLIEPADIFEHFAVENQDNAKSLHKWAS
jgi:rubrerythrin